MRKTLYRSLGNRALRSVLCLLVLTAAPARGQQLPGVGKNCHVSADVPDVAHQEVVIAADPKNPERLVAASMATSERLNKIYTVVYASRDGGSTWRRTLDTSGDGLGGYDPAVTYGPDGSAYFCVIKDVSLENGSQLYLSRSRDGGFNWEPPVQIPAAPDADREWVVVDHTGGKYHGRVYVFLHAATRSLGDKRLPRSLALHASGDGGASFGAPAKLQALDRRSVFYPGNGVILSDGTLVAVVTELRGELDQEGEMRPVEASRGRPNATVYAVKSEDGGLTLKTAGTISDNHRPAPPMGLHVATVPSLAVDGGSEHFKDRLYAAWTDSRTGRSEIYFSYSADKGATWVKPKIVSDDRLGGSSAAGPDNFHPAVAVNNRGVVGVMWYDRRDQPDNLGWDVRFAASLDGGETFSPSVAVSEKPMSQAAEHRPIRAFSAKGDPAKGTSLSFRLDFDSFSDNGGHTAGLAAGAAGDFYPLWIDNRTGVRQVWTARVRVEGEAAPNGGAELAGLKDFTGSMAIDFSNSSYDPVAGTMAVDVRLRNTSGQALEGPLMVRALALRSGVSSAIRVLKSDNGREGPGAVWDFTPLLRNNRLGPGEITPPKRIFFRIAEPRYGDQQTFDSTMAVGVDARVLARGLPGQ